MSKTIIDRILAIQKLEGITKNAFEASIGKSSGYLKLMSNNGGNPGVDVLLKLIEVYPKYSVDWILSGKGTPEKEIASASNSMVEEGGLIYGKDPFKEVLLDYLKDTDIKLAIIDILKK